jgi:hypothetical protein
MILSPDYRWSEFVLNATYTVYVRTRPLGPFCWFLCKYFIKPPQLLRTNVIVSAKLLWVSQLSHAHVLKASSSSVPSLVFFLINTWFAFLDKTKACGFLLSRLTNFFFPFFLDQVWPIKNRAISNWQFFVQIWSLPAVNARKRILKQDSRSLRSVKLAWDLLQFGCIFWKMLDNLCETEGVLASNGKLTSLNVLIFLDPFSEAKFKSLNY